MADTYQLSLLGDPPKKGREWQRPFYGWQFCGIPVPLSDDAARQVRLMRADTLTPEAPDAQK